MLYGGIDIGAQSVKAVVFDGEKIIGNKSAVTEKEADAAAKEVFEDLLTDLQYQAQDVAKCLLRDVGRVRSLLRSERARSRSAQLEGLDGWFPRPALWLILVQRDVG